MNKDCVKLGSPPVSYSEVTYNSAIRTQMNPRWTLHWIKATSEMAFLFFLNHHPCIFKKYQMSLDKSTVFCGILHQ